MPVYPVIMPTRTLLLKGPERACTGRSLHVSDDKNPFAATFIARRASSPSRALQRLHVLSPLDIPYKPLEGGQAIKVPFLLF